MQFELLQSISLNGGMSRANDDRAGSATTLAWIIDGATDLAEPGLLGAQGGAAWIASAASAAFGRLEQAGLRETCAAVFDELATAYANARRRPPVAPWEAPKAAFAAAQLVGAKLQVAWAADCPILLARGQKVRWCTPPPDTADEAAAALAVGPNLKTPAALADRRAHRGQPDHGALGVEPAASSAATQFACFDVATGDRLLMMSDGFSCLFSDYAAYDAPGLMAAVEQRGLAALAQEIREIEAGDAACTRYPRFKQSDDATALLMRVIG